MSRKTVWTCCLVVLAALWLLRAQLIAEVGVPFEQALALGLSCGVLLDLAMVLLIAGAAICVGAWQPRLAPSTALALSAVVVGFSTANVAYFGYFDARLEPWVIRTHLRDLPAIGGSVRSVLGAPALFACVIAIPLLFLTLRSLRSRSTAPVVPASLGCAFVIAAFALAFSATVLKHRIVDGASILAEQVFVVWIEDALGLLPHEASRRREMEDALRGAATVDPLAPGRVLATLRDWDPTNEQLPDSSDFDTAQPLVRELTPNPTHTRALRERLGLPADGPIHIIILFLESVRAFELEHPSLGPQVFPRTRALLARHSLRFPTAYSSTPDVGKTVQGQFATLCSLLPNFGGAAAYTSHPYLRVKSLAEIAREHGYHTLWISGSNESFHNKRVFESLHGTDRFFGFEYLRHIPYGGTPLECGYPDSPMLQEAVRILEREARDGQPVFANILTLSTHHPVTEIPEGPVPAALRAAAKARPAQKEYAGYLSRLRYLDETLEPFFNALFASAIGDRTLVVLLGDHGQRYKSHLSIAQHQVAELMARIPFAIVTKHLPTPAVIAHAVHQIDVAPTVADIVGFQGSVAWIGRNVLDGPGSPWVVAEKQRLHYRVGDRVCYTLQGDDVPSCYRIDAGLDPMLSFDLPRTPSDVAEVRFFQSVAVAARQAITLNLVMPAALQR
jgi:hypothetical protein